MTSGILLSLMSHHSLEGNHTLDEGQTQKEGYCDHEDYGIHWSATPARSAPGQLFQMESESLTIMQHCAVYP